MALYKVIVFMLLAGCSATPVALAQMDAPKEKRWTIRAYYGAGGTGTSGGLVDFLEANGFDDFQRFFGATIDYPVARTEGAEWSFLAAYALRPPLSVGASFHRAVGVSAAGFRNDTVGSEELTVQQEMWAAGPVVLWRPFSNVAFGLGPTLIGGEFTLLERRFVQGERMPPQASSVIRPGAIAFASLGFTLFSRSLYVGLQGHFLYGGEVEMGLFDLDERFVDLEIDALGSRRLRLSQFTLGPVVALSF